MNDAAMKMSTIDSSPGPAIAENAACRQCGYNLRGLSPLGDCPECALPIELSLKSLFLKDANPDWLRRLRIGLWIEIVIAVLGLMHYWSFAIGSMRSLSFYFSVYLSFQVLSCAGIWILTSAEPSQANERSHWNSRTRLRWIAVASLVSDIIEIAVIQLLGLSHVSMLYLIVGSRAISISYSVLEFGYLIQINRRIPNAFCIGLAKLMLVASLLYIVVTGTSHFITIWSVQYQIPFGVISAIQTIGEYSQCSLTLITIGFVALFYRTDMLIRYARDNALSYWRRAISQSPLSDSQIYPS